MMVRDAYPPLLLDDGNGSDSVPDRGHLPDTAYRGRLVESIYSGSETG